MKTNKEIMEAMFDACLEKIDSWLGKINDRLEKREVKSIGNHVHNRESDSR
jgi:hypothetical protein